LVRRCAILAPTEHRELLSNAKAFAAVTFEAAARSDTTGDIGEGTIDGLHRCGLAMAPFAEPLGGAGLADGPHSGELCTLLRILGGADLSLARLFEGHVNAIALVMRYGTKTQLARLADEVGNGRLTGVWGAEDNVGLHLVRRPNGWQLSGRKVFASGAGLITRPLVTVSTEDGPVMYLLDTSRDAGIDLSAWRPLGMRSSATGTVDFSGIKVAPDDRIGVAGDFLRQPFFSGGAWRFCAAHLGAVECLVELYREHLLERGRGSDPYQLERLAHCTAAAGTALFWIEEAARRFSDEALDTAGVVAFANLTRMVTERMALDVMENAQRGIGLAAFIQPNPIERICRDLATYLRQPVPDRAMADAARAVLQGDLRIGASV
jgi:alkylation response protein AidB-like acyl-CoA dehydrogenase